MFRVSATLELISSRASRADHKWQAKERQGFDAESFQFDWEAQHATCPAGRKSLSWTPAIDRSDNQVIKITFSLKDCRSCPLKAHCTTAPRRTITIRTQEHHQALQAVRTRQKEATSGKSIAPDPGSKARSLKASARIWNASESLSRHAENPLPGSGHCRCSQPQAHSCLVSW